MVLALLSIALVALAIGIGVWLGRRRRPTPLASDVTRQWLHENRYTKDGDRS